MFDFAISNQTLQLNFKFVNSDVQATTYIKTDRKKMRLAFLSIDLATRNRF